MTRYDIAFEMKAFLAMVGYSRRHVYRLIDAGIIQARRLGERGHYHFTLDVINDTRERISLEPLTREQAMEIWEKQYGN